MYGKSSNRHSRHERRGRRAPWCKTPVPRAPFPRGRRALAIAQIVIVTACPMDRFSISCQPDADHREFAQTPPATDFAREHAKLISSNWAVATTVNGAWSSSMNTSTLYVSFWHICLSNLPTGHFTRRCLSAVEARRLISDARASRNLVSCVSADDLVAPYGKSERQRHEELCAILQERYGIAISTDDFLGCPDADDPDLAFSLPLNVVKVGRDSKLLVIDSLYQMNGALRRGPEGTVGFSIASDSVSFTLIEMLSAGADRDVPNHG